MLPPLSFLATSAHADIPNIVSLRLAVKHAPHHCRYGHPNSPQSSGPPSFATVVKRPRSRTVSPQPNVLHCPTPVLSRPYANTVSARPRCHVPIQHPFLTRLVVPRLGSCASGIVCRMKSRCNKRAKPACYASWVLRASEVPPVKLGPAVRPSHCLLSLKRMLLRELRVYAPHNIMGADPSLVLPHHPEGVAGVQLF